MKFSCRLCRISGSAANKQAIVFAKICGNESIQQVPGQGRYSPCSHRSAVLFTRLLFSDTVLFQHPMHAWCFPKHTFGDEDSAAKALRPKISGRTKLHVLERSGDMPGVPLIAHALPKWDRQQC
jgi:hypothetical protein